MLVVLILKYVENKKCVYWCRGGPIPLHANILTCIYLISIYTNHINNAKDPTIYNFDKKIIIRR